MVSAGPPRQLGFGGPHGDGGIDVGDIRGGVLKFKTRPRPIEIFPGEAVIGPSGTGTIEVEKWTKPASVEPTKHECPTQASEIPAQVVAVEIQDGDGIDIEGTEKLEQRVARSRQSVF